jgi:hypothetical protein
LIEFRRFIKATPVRRARKSDDWEDFFSEDDEIGNSQPSEAGGDEVWRICFSIDAICINQRDLQERSKQIRYMPKIYSKAAKLVIWLDAEANRSETAMRMISTMAKRYRTVQRSGQDRGALKDWILQCFLVNLRQGSDILGAFLRRPWFTRAWILQEFVLGSQLGAVYFCGRRRLDHSDMDAFMNCCDSILPAVRNLKMSVQRCELARHNSRGFYGQNVLWRSKSFTQTQCSKMVSIVY